ncbi:hypothetical protein BD410DRAFT_582188 [Rickenella mellea]|uniref:Secreted protein n=1 Tax=Rickenella mellea TaxID=50990 RepID=A0A4Y7PQI4_9AGAM|nr:hypothetical protein BD410DRAFT_582188 [Rickenella mellea]
MFCRFWSLFVVSRLVRLFSKECHGATLQQVHLFVSRVKECHTCKVEHSGSWTSAITFRLRILQDPIVRRAFNAQLSASAFYPRDRLIQWIPGGMRMGSRASCAVMAPLSSVGALRNCYK